MAIQHRLCTCDSGSALGARGTQARYSSTSCPGSRALEGADPGSPVARSAVAPPTPKEARAATLATMVRFTSSRWFPRVRDRSLRPRAYSGCQGRVKTLRGAERDPWVQLLSMGGIRDPVVTVTS